MLPPDHWETLWFESFVANFVLLEEIVPNFVLLEEIVPEVSAVVVVAMGLR